MPNWKSKLKTGKRWPLIGLLAFTFSFGFNIAAAEGAMLYFSPSSGNQTAGNILNVNVLVNTQSKAINNADAAIRFPANLLEVVSISKTGSIFSLWVEEPVFSNTLGTINLNGGLPTPGYNGPAGRIITITFRIKAAGSASLVFTSGAVRANDGLGTDVLSSLGTATYTISPAPIAPPPETSTPPVVGEPTVETLPEPDEITAGEILLKKLFNYISSLSASKLLLIQLIIILIISLLIYGRRRFTHLRSNVRRETYDAERNLDHSFDTLKEDITACVGLLERIKSHRHLTEEERAIVSLLRQHLRETKTLAIKEIHDIRRHTKR